jgi:myosin heavy subunit
MCFKNPKYESQYRRRVAYGENPKQVERDIFEKRKQEHRKKINRLLKNNKEQKRQLITLKNSNQLKDREILKLKLQNYKSNHSLQTQHKTLQTKHETLQTQHETLQTQHETLQTKHETLQTQHKTLQTQHETLQTKHETLQTQHKTLQTQHETKAHKEHPKPINLPIQLTPDNAKEYLGYEIVFKSRGKEVKRRILRVAESGKSISVDFPYLKNTLQIITRKVYVCL